MTENGTEPTEFAGWQPFTILFVPIPQVFLGDELRQVAFTGFRDRSVPWSIEAKTQESIMTDQDKLAVDEYNETVEHQTIKQDVRRSVQSDIVRGAAEPNRDIAAEALSVGRRLKEKAVHDVIRNEAEVSRTRAMARISQVIDYFFGIIYGIIGLEIALDLLGARPGSGFKILLDRIAAPLLAPFNGLMAEPSKGLYRLKLSYIVALIVYVLINVAVNGLLRVVARRRATI